MVEKEEQYGRDLIMRNKSSLKKKTTQDRKCSHPPHSSVPVDVDVWHNQVRLLEINITPAFLSKLQLSWEFPRLHYSCPNFMAFIIFDYHLPYYLPNIFSFN